MQIANLIKDNNKFHLELISSGNSVAYFVPERFDKMTCQVSNISGGSLVVQYSLSRKQSILDDTAIWHSWSEGSISSITGISFDSPVAYLRIIAEASVSYIFELLVW